MMILRRGLPTGASSLHLLTVEASFASPVVRPRRRGISAKMNFIRENGVTSSATRTIRMAVNGRDVEGQAEGRTLLVEFLRQQLRLTGAHVGCDTSQCGACVVHVNGRSVKSCTMLAMEAEGAEVRTIEGMAEADGSLGVIQKAFREHHGLQCGFCTPGMVMSAADLLQTNPSPSSTEVREWLEGNICRCTGYHNIVKAIMAAAAELRGEATAAE